MPLIIERNDLSAIEADAVIVPANEHLKITGGPATEIARAAGFAKMQEACDAIGRCEKGSAVVTPGFDSSYDHVIHAVAPTWHNGRWGEAEQLRSTYDAALSAAAERGARSISMPLLVGDSSGFPPAVVLGAAREAARSFLEHYDAEVSLALGSDPSLQDAIEDLDAIEDHIEVHYKGRHGGEVRAENLWGNHGVVIDGLEEEPSADPEAQAEEAPDETLTDGAREQDADTVIQDLLDSLDEPFAPTVLALVSARGMTDPEAARNANMSKQRFDRIRSARSYSPTKADGLALAMALRLGLPETVELLRRGDIALSQSSKSDVIAEYFIQNGIHDILRLNEALVAFDQDPL